MDLNEMTANLIDNACKWASGAVTVRGFVENGRTGVVITVDDDGPGLPAEAMERVFKIGERLDDQVPGSGLGLPIVRDLARLYGGEIRLNNSAQGGLGATLRLPTARAYPDAAGSPSVSDGRLSRLRMSNRFFDRRFMTGLVKIRPGRAGGKSKPVQ
jgi:signal transduction histidine kinase